MKPISIIPFRQWLFSYAAGFISSKESARKIFEIKREHCLHVAENCRDIAGDLGWGKHETAIAEILGLLHDTGRFSQFVEYGTFMDTISIDHGARGVEVVKRAGIIDSLEMRDRARIIDGIFLHNRRTIPPESAPDSLPFVKLVRDADKLDILRIGVERMDSGVFFEHLRTAVGITKKGPATPAAVEDVLARRLVSLEHLHTVEDCILMQISWVSDISYSSTLRRVMDHGYLECFTRNLTEDISRRAASFLMS